MVEPTGVMYESGKTYDSMGRILRNRLNLKQRIEVINAFKHTPDIGQLANMFQCGRRQIKHILSKRKSYMAMWNPKPVVPQISFKVRSTIAIEIILHEWIQRARCYQINITDDILRSFAQEIADHVKAKDFKATNTAWLSRFKEKFDVVDIHIKPEPGTSLGDRKPLSIGLIIADLRQQHGDDVILPTEEVNQNDDDDVVFNDDTEAPGNVDVNMAGYSSSESPDSGIQMDSMSSSGTDFAREIDTYKEALNQLGPLEQFALLKENIRAVGLINQLENLFREEMARSEMK